MNYLGCTIIEVEGEYWVYVPPLEFYAITDTLDAAYSAVHLWEKETEHLVLGSRN